ncbi:MAG: hypothetical protein ETSY2_02335 [Candidatus Entotheonella gemina]|uniref:Uncharacterized protein n=1 Tax=Candidatus Entotheonella gemina TaxID=1429439 RepID=W4MGA0_9BACT|nr:MAG: hypothetical protein ETSY2_02335 [Candidatus Entotheonella gemina]
MASMRFGNMLILTESDIFVDIMTFKLVTVASPYGLNDVYLQYKSTRYPCCRGASDLGMYFAA